MPFGFAAGADGELVEVATEQDAIALIRRLKAEGRALRPIAEAVAATGSDRSGLARSRASCSSPAPGCVRHTLLQKPRRDERAPAPRWR